jgi:hypothetical protein
MIIQSTIGGYQGTPVTILGVYDENTGSLTIVSQKEYTESRLRPDVALVTNLQLPEHDSFFGDEKLSEAITHFFVRKAQGTLILDPKLSRYNPENKLQLKGVNEGGKSYEISPDIDNGQIAVLAMVAYVDAAAAHSAVCDAWDLLNGFSV